MTPPLLAFGLICRVRGWLRSLDILGCIRGVAPSPLSCPLSLMLHFHPGVLEMGHSPLRAEEQEQQEPRPRRLYAGSWHGVGDSQAQSCWLCGLLNFLLSLSPSLPQGIPLSTDRKQPLKLLLNGKHLAPIHCWFLLHRSQGGRTLCFLRWNEINMHKPTTQTTA